MSSRGLCLRSVKIQLVKYLCATRILWDSSTDLYQLISLPARDPRRQDPLLEKCWRFHCDSHLAREIVCRSSCKVPLHFQNLSTVIGHQSQLIRKIFKAKPRRLSLSFPIILCRNVKRTGYGSAPCRQYILVSLDCRVPWREDMQTRPQILYYSLLKHSLHQDTEEGVIDQAVDRLGSVQESLRGVTPSLQLAALVLSLKVFCFFFLKTLSKLSAQLVLAEMRIGLNRLRIWPTHQSCLLAIHLLALRFQSSKKSMNGDSGWHPPSDKHSPPSSFTN